MAAKDMLRDCLRSLPQGALQMINPSRIICMTGYTQEEMGKAVAEFQKDGVLVPFYIYTEGSETEYEIEKEDIDQEKGFFIHPETGEPVSTGLLDTYYSVDKSKL